MYGVATKVLARKDPIEALEILIQKGIDVVELSYENFTHGDYRKIISLTKNYVRENSIKVQNVHTPQGSETDWIYSPNTSLRNKIHKMFNDWITLCGEVNCKYVIVHINIPLPTSNNFKDVVNNVNYKVYVNFLKKLHKIATDIGAKLALENRYARKFGSRAEELEFIINDINEDLSVCIDVGHLNANGYRVSDFFNKLGKYVEAVHLHDNNGKNDQHLPPFTGTINWDEVIKSLRSINFSNPPILEVYCKNDDIKCVNLVNLSKIIGEYLSRLIFS